MYGFPVTGVERCLVFYGLLLRLLVCFVLSNCDHFTGGKGAKRLAWRLLVCPLFALSRLLLSLWWQRRSAIFYYGFLLFSDKV